MNNHIVKSYDDDLKRLKNELIAMGTLVHQQLKRALESLEKRDRSLALHVIETDKEIDGLEAQIDQQSLQILALRQPVALDLRIVIAALKIANSFERVGDYAANISRRVLALTESGSLGIDTPVLLSRMMMITHHMIEDLLKGFFSQDISIVQQSWEKDLEVDGLYAALLRELLTYMMEDPRRISPCTHFLFIAKNVERVGDHLTNIAEVLYVMIQGKPLEMNRPHTERFC